MSHCVFPSSFRCPRIVFVYDSVVYFFTTKRASSENVGADVTFAYMTREYGIVHDVQ